MKNNFPPIKWHTFLFGQAEEEHFSQLYAAAEGFGLEVVQVLQAAVEVQPTLLAPPGARPHRVVVYRLIVRIPVGEVDAFNERVRLTNEPVGKAN